MKRTLGKRLHFFWFAAALLWALPSFAQEANDTTSTGSTGSLSLPDPANYQREIIYDPITGNYLVYRRYGDVLFMTPEVWTTDQYRQYMYSQSEQDYFGNKSALYNASGDSPRDDVGLVPQIQTGNEALGQVFGSDIVEIRPQGMAEIRFRRQVSVRTKPWHSCSQPKDLRVRFWPAHSDECKG
jgi:cell surface protein SprA